MVIMGIVAVCLAAMLVLPDVFGRRAEKIYRNSINQIVAAGYAVRLDSYQRGWFDSRATLTLPVGTGAQVMVQRIHHGPLGFYNGWLVAFPVAAVIETDLPAKAEKFLDNSLGVSPVTISTVVAMDGGLDTYISREPSERRDPAHNLTVKFMGFQAEWRYSQDRSMVYGGTPGITATGAFGEADIGGVTIRGQSHLFSRDVRVGSSKIDIGRVAYSVVGNARRPSRTGLAQGISISLIKSMNEGKVDLREKIAVEKASGRNLEAGPMDLLVEMGNISPEPSLQFRKEVAAIELSGLDKQARARAVQAKTLDLLIATVKQSPLLSVDLHVSSPKGDSTGQAKMGIAPEFADDPVLKTKIPPKLLFALALKKYGYFSGNVEAPAAFLEQMVSAKHLNDLQQAHILVRSGANYTVRASYKEGKFLVNGRKFTLPHHPCPPVNHPCRGAPRTT